MKEKEVNAIINNICDKVGIGIDGMKDFVPIFADKMKSKYYHLPNGDIAIPLIDIEHAPTVIEGEV